MMTSDLSHYASPIARLDDRGGTDLETLVISKVGGIIYKPSDIRAIYTVIECVCSRQARSGTVCSCKFERHFLPRIEAAMFEIDPSPPVGKCGTFQL